MTNLTDMKLTKKESKESSGIPAVDDRPRFPFGLEIRLDDDSLKKLGFDSLPAVGEEFIVIGVGPVTSVSENQRQGSEVNRHLEIQLQRIEIEPLDDGSDETAVDAVSRGIKDA